MRWEWYEINLIFWLSKHVVSTTALKFSLMCPINLRFLQRCDVQSTYHIKFFSSSFFHEHIIEFNDLYLFLLSFPSILLCCHRLRPIHLKIRQAQRERKRCPKIARTWWFVELCGGICNIDPQNYRLHRLLTLFSLCLFSFYHSPNGNSTPCW